MESLALAPGTLEAFGLYLIRTSVMFLASPLLGLGAGFTGYKLAAIMSLALFLYAIGGEPLPSDTGVLVFAAMAVREGLLGLALGMIMRLLVLASYVAGELIGHEMGAAIARQVDPESGVNVPLVTRIYENFILLALLTINGHHWLIRALGRSFDRAPVGRIGIGTELTPTVAQLFTDMFAAGLSFAAPVMTILMLASILVGLLSRAVPYLNILEISFSIRIVLALTSMFLFAPLLEPVMTGLFGRMDYWIDRMLAAMEA